VVSVSWRATSDDRRIRAREVATLDAACYPPVLITAGSAVSRVRSGSGWSTMRSNRSIPISRGLRSRGAGQRLLGAALLVSAVLGSASEALALQGGEDPSTLPVLVDKRFGQAGRHQLSLFFSTSMVTKFVEGVGAFGAYQYNFSDTFGLELHGGYFFGSETSIMREVRENFPNKEPPLSDLYQLQWVTGIDAVLVPVYGKISFASELDPQFDIFLLAGAGVGGTRRQAGIDTITYDSAVTPVFNVGGGMRFYFSKLAALRLEFRSFFYPDPAAGDPVFDPDQDIGGLTWNLHFQAGLQFAFGGDE
jgi:outer membrane beta-barrel protein